jgi:hypothetical protein
MSLTLKAHHGDFPSALDLHCAGDPYVDLKDYSAGLAVISRRSIVE